LFIERQIERQIFRRKIMILKVKDEQNNAWEFFDNISHIREFEWHEHKIKILKDNESDVGQVTIIHTPVTGQNAKDDGPCKYDHLFCPRGVKDGDNVKMIWCKRNDHQIVIALSTIRAYLLNDEGKTIEIL
jgi:hypothetical protein